MLSVESVSVHVWMSVSFYVFVCVCVLDNSAVAEPPHCQAVFHFSETLSF